MQQTLPGNRSVQTWLPMQSLFTMCFLSAQWNFQWLYSWPMTPRKVWYASMFDAFHLSSGTRFGLRSQIASWRSNWLLETTHRAPWLWLACTDSCIVDTDCCCSAMQGERYLPLNEYLYIALKSATLMHLLLGLQYIPWCKMRSECCRQSNARI